MAADPSAGTDDPAGRDYHGQPTHHLGNDHLWVDVLTAAGPRIIRFGLAGSSRNLLAETPDLGWETPHGRYELFGGHRLWFAPEDPDRVAVPDGHGLVLEVEPDELRLTGPAEAPSGLVRSMTLHLVPDRPALEIRHALHNVSDAPLELAPWAITQLPLGGIVLMPQPPATPGHHVQPNRTLVLWPYTSWEDPRLRPLDGLVTVHAVAGPGMKVGYFNLGGWVAYARDGVALVRRFVPMTGEPHADLGCNVEVFVGGKFLELELLGPLARLDAGCAVSLTETWAIETTGPLVAEADLRAVADRLTRS